MPDSTIVRPATRDNIDGVRSIAHAYGNLGYWSRRPYYLDHEMESGRLLVAEDGGGGGMLAFVAVLERGGWRTWRSCSSGRTDWAGVSAADS